LVGLKKCSATFITNTIFVTYNQQLWFGEFWYHNHHYDIVWWQFESLQK